MSSMISHKPSPGLLVFFSLLLSLVLSGDLPARGSADENSAIALQQEKATVEVVDSQNRLVMVGQPVEAVVCLNSGLTEVVAALGASERMVGRCSYSTFPSGMKEVPIVGKHSYSPNMETLIAVQPDLVIADPMFDDGKIEILERQGISVIIESTSDPDRLPVLVRNLGTALGEAERAEEILSLVDETLEEVNEAITALNLSEDGKVRVFFENRKAYKSASGSTGYHGFLAAAGGRNIATDELVRYPILSPEFIAMENPDTMIRRTSGDLDQQGMEELKTSIMERDEISSITALVDDRVFIVKSDLFISLRYPAGIAYFAKILYPDIALEPAEIHRWMIDRLYGTEEWPQLDECFIYPDP